MAIPPSITVANNATGMTTGTSHRCRCIRHATASVNDAQGGTAHDARCASAEPEVGSLNEKGELPEIERAGVTARRWTVCPLHDFTRRGGAQVGGEKRHCYGTGKQAPDGIVDCRSGVDDNIHAIEKDGIRIMLAPGQRLELLGRLRTWFGSIAAVVVMMVVAAWTMMMVAVAVTSRSKIRVKMRTEIMSGRLVVAVRVAEHGN